MKGAAFDAHFNDDIDTRRELLILLQKLTPKNRLRFLAWAAAQGSRDVLGRQCADGGMIQHKVSSRSTGEDVHEIYWDTCMILILGLSIENAMEQLGRMVRLQSVTKI